MAMLTKVQIRLVVCGLCIITATALGERKKPTTMQTCNKPDCHDQFEMKEYLHGPIALGECTGCHKPDDVARHTFKFAREGNDLCVNCHPEQTAGKNVHKPVKEGKCIQCHDSHSSDNKGLLHKKTVAEVCAECHKVTEHEHLHGPIAVGECSICHNPHSSDEKSLLTVKPSELCVSCHEVTKNELEKFEFIHEPAKGDCVSCHDPHGADNWKMLKAEAPEMCYECHEEIKKISAESKYKHSVVATKGGCLKCHTPHASTVKYLLKAPPTDLCMGCHNKPQRISKDEVLPAFTELKNKKFLHGPLKEKDCSGCHKAHGSNHFRLLAESYPPIFYSPFAEENYALCFLCHEKSLVRTEKTEDLTSFRNGSQNLHFLHVNKERHGRTCRACHQTHASNQPKHIRESVPYGMWDLPLNFKKTKTGGSCLPGCHVKKDYDRDNPVDYSVSRLPKETEAKPDEGAKPAEGGEEKKPGENNV